jgi:hypothetical protein
MGRPHVVQNFLEFLPSQKFVSVNMVAVKQQIEAAQKIPKPIMAVAGAKLF